ncbi:MAG: DeoR/GlpR transcriptional regulator [Oscillospiraceae bacterium]|nr:DeoR/GlpR transcriptional regulator [Oscillospiraceae bacterium]
MYSIRQEQIREYIEEKNVVTIKELQALFPSVSLMTIHRDLDALERLGAVVKFRGGAKSVRLAGDPDFNVRMRENNAGKTAIARKALTLIQPHSSVFLDASTTNLALARALPDINLNIITTGPSIALELCRLHNPVVTLCCGTINRKNLAISGQNTLEMLEKINIDGAFVGVSGCSVDAGFTCGMEGDMLVKRLVIRKARTSVAMCGHEKFSCLMPYTFAQVTDVDYLITDGDVPDAFAQAAKAANVTIL